MKNLIILIFLISIVSHFKFDGRTRTSVKSNTSKDHLYKISKKIKNVVYSSRRINDKP